ncbi:MAG: Glyoxylate reductase [Clostridia bacterium]|nr:Glyoxylate reductase [Clostridia bacterium]
MRKLIAATISYCKYTDEPVTKLKEKGIEIIKDYGLKELKNMSEETRKSVEAIVVGLEKVTPEVMDLLPNLKVIAKHGAGTDNIDSAEAAKRNIKVFNVPGANSTAVADLAMALMLDASRMVCIADKSVRSGKWERFYGVELADKTLSILGFGAIGKAVAKRALGFGMQVIVYDVVKSDFEGVEFVSLDEAIKRADYLTLHMPLIDSTKHVINEKTISTMKENAFIINAARGGLIDENALLDALEDKKIAGAGLDVFETEANVNPRFFALDNVVLTPHIAGFSEEAINRISIRCTEYILECCCKEEGQC